MRGGAMTMEDLVTWLCNIEDLACNFHKRDVINIYSLEGRIKRNV